MEKKTTTSFAPFRRGAFKTGRMRVPELRGLVRRVARAKATFPLQQDTDDGALRPRLYCTSRERARMFIRCVSAHRVASGWMKVSRDTIVSRANCTHNREADRVSVRGLSSREYLQLSYLSNSNRIRNQLNRQCSHYIKRKPRPPLRRPTRNTQLILIPFIARNRKRIARCY